MKLYSKGREVVILFVEDNYLKDNERHKLRTKYMAILEYNFRTDLILIFLNQNKNNIKV